MLSGSNATSEDTVATPIYDNSAAIQEYEKFAKVINEFTADPTSHSKSFLENTIQSAIRTIGNDDHASDHCVMVLVTLINYITESLVEPHPKPTDLVFALVSQRRFDIYKKYININASLDTLYIHAIQVNIDAALLNLLDIRNPVLTVRTKNILEQFLSVKNKSRDATTLLAKFIFMQLHYSYNSLHLFPGKLNASSSLFDKAAFNRLYREEKNKAIQDNTAMSSEERCFQILIDIYNQNIIFYNQLLTNHFSLNETTAERFNKQYKCLFDDEFVSCIDALTREISIDNINRLSPKDHKLSLFKLMHDEAMNPISIYIDTLRSATRQDGEHLTVKDSKAQIKSNDFLIMNINQLIKLLTWCMKVYSYELVKNIGHTKKSDHEIIVRNIEIELKNLHKQLASLKESKLESQTISSTARMTTVMNDDAKKAIIEELLNEDSKGKKGKKPTRTRRKHAKTKSSQQSKPAAPITSSSNTRTESLPSPEGDDKDCHSIKKINIFLPDHVSSVIDTIKRDGQRSKCYVVGGAVRDWYFSIPPNDYDLAVTTDMQDIINFFSKKGKIVNTFTRNFTFTHEDGLQGIDICPLTTSYVDRASASHTETVIIKDRFMIAYDHTDNIVLDAKRRNFTCNALYYDGDSNEILDPTGLGIEDIKNLRIRFIHPILEIILKEPTLILRGMALEARTPLRFSPEDKELLKANSHLMSRATSDILGCAIDRLIESHNQNAESLTAQLDDFNLSFLEPLAREQIDKGSSDIKRYRLHDNIR